VEGEALMPLEPGGHLGVFVGGVVVEDHMDRLAGRHLALDGIEKADEFLMPVVLHAAPDDLAFEDIEGGEQGGGAVALVIMGHGGAAPLLHRQSRLGAVESLDLAFLVDAEDHGMRRRIDVEADDILELVGEFGVVGDFEGAHPMRLKPLPRPDAPHRGRADPNRLGHRRCGPVGCRMRWRLVGQRHDPIDGRGRQRRNPRGPGLGGGSPPHPFLHEALLPTPDHGFVLADRAGDGVGALAIRRQHNNPCAPDVLLRAVAIPCNCVQPDPISGRERDGYSLAHRPPSHKTAPQGIPIRSHPSGAIH
jgi:hypothetical protein